jgi:hypothetical protein
VIECNRECNTFVPKTIPIKVILSNPPWSSFLSRPNFDIYAPTPFAPPQRTRFRPTCRRVERKGVTVKRPAHHAKVARRANSFLKMAMPQNLEYVPETPTVISKQQQQHQSRRTPANSRKIVPPTKSCTTTIMMKKIVAVVWLLLASSAITGALNLPCDPTTDRHCFELVPKDTIIDDGQDPNSVLSTFCSAHSLACLVSSFVVLANITHLPSLFCCCPNAQTRKSRSSRPSARMTAVAAVARVYTGE